MKHKNMQLPVVLGTLILLTLTSCGAAPSMEDIGILASLDPIALDQACVDLVYAAPDGADLIERMESRNAIHAIDYAVAIGFGNREYQLVSIDD